MSRSYKKPWLKDPANSYMKRIHARIMRRKTRQILGEYRKTMLPEWDWKFWFYLDLWEEDVDTHPIYKDDDGPEIPHYRAVTNQYDICDFIFYGSDPEYRRK